MKCPDGVEEAEDSGAEDLADGGTGGQEDTGGELGITGRDGGERISLDGDGGNGLV